MDGFEEAKWNEGVWLGFGLGTHQKIIGAPNGVVKANGIQRRPFEERWSSEAIEGRRIVSRLNNPSNRLER